MALIKANTRETDWVTGDSGQDEIYIPYFAQRRSILMGRYAGNPAELSAILAGLLAHQQGVYVTSRVLENPQWKDDPKVTPDFIQQPGMEFEIRFLDVAGKSYSATYTLPKKTQ